MSAAVEPFDLLDRDDIEPNYDEDPPDLPPEELDALSLADWHARKVAGIRAQRAALTEQFEAETRRIKMRLDARLEVLAGAEQWHLRPLEHLHRAILERDAKRKTITLTCGAAMKARGQQPEWDYPDLAAFLSWAVANAPELIADTAMSFKVPAAHLADVIATVTTLNEAGTINDPKSSEALPDKAAVKQALVKRDAKGNPIVYGVDPASGEKVPGLLVTDRPDVCTLDTSGV